MMTSQKHKFSLPPDLIYLNVAYMAPLLKLAQVQGMDALLKKSNPTHYGMQDFFGDSDRLKATFGELISAPASQIAIIPSVSYGMANAAKNIDYKKNGKILVLAEQFPSNYYPWQRAAAENDQKLEVVGPSPSPAPRSASWNENLLASIDDQTSAVTMCHAHWADGTLYDLTAISAACQKHDAYLIIDGTQSIGALPLSIAELKVDVLIAGGYKWLLGHYGMGLAYYSERFNDGTPIEDNWINKKDSDNFQSLVHYQDQYRAGATRYSVGEKSNFIHTAILQAGMEQILEWGVSEIQAYCRQLHLQLYQALEGSPFALTAPDASSSHLTSIRLQNDINMEHIKKTLMAENIHVSYRGDAMRVSLYVHNDEAEMERFASVLKGLA